MKKKKNVTEKNESFLINDNNTHFNSQLCSSTPTALEATSQYDIPDVFPGLGLMARAIASSSTFTCWKSRFALSVLNG